MRVAESIRESVAVSFPVATVPGPSTFTLTSMPGLSRMASCCGTEKLT